MREAEDHYLNTRRISIIAPAYNEESKIEELGSSISNQRTSEGIDVLIFISDNGSTDKTPETAREVGTIVTGSLPRNIGSARRVGAEAALQTSDIDRNHILVFTDADATFLEHYIESVNSMFTENPDINVAYGPARYKFTHGITIQPPAKLINFFRKQILKNLYQFYGRDFKDFVKPPYHFFPGYNLAIRANTYVESGGFSDEARGADDLDFSLRLKDSLPKEAIRFNRGQVVTISGRAYENSRNIPSIKRVIADLKGEHVPYHNDSEDLSDSQIVVQRHIERTERRIYSLQEKERVVGIYRKSENLPVISFTRIIQARNHLGELIPGKIAVIDSK